MACKGGKRKDIKKSSYYVWFLGAKESCGLRGEEYIQPVVHYFLAKERDLEPMKVTLQVSNKGLKIIQSIPKKNNAHKLETLKHFIPHHAITCCMQGYEPNDDLVSCILLIYNPVTKCPVHVHTYRCDSVETASVLKKQLQVLIDRSENQNKIEEIENRLYAKGLLVSKRPSSNPDLKITPANSDSSSNSLDREIKFEQMSTLYNSLTAELKEKLTCKETGPILLPPKDYDTIVRRHGNFDPSTRKLPVNLKIGYDKQHSKHYGERESSGIGSDETSSPEQINERFNALCLDREREWSSSNGEEYSDEDKEPETFHFAWKRTTSLDQPSYSLRDNQCFFSRSHSKDNLNFSEDLGYNSPPPKKEYFFGENPLDNLDISRPRSYLDLISPERILKSKTESDLPRRNGPTYNCRNNNKSTPEPYIFSKRETYNSETELRSPKHYLYSHLSPKS